MTLNVNDVNLEFTKKFALRFIETYDKLIDGLSREDRVKIPFGKYRPFSIQIQYGVLKGFAILLIPMPDRREEFEYLVRENKLDFFIRGQIVDDTGDGTIRLQNENGTMLIYSTKNSPEILTETMAENQAKIFFQQDVEKYVKK